MLFTLCLHVLHHSMTKTLIGYSLALTYWHQRRRVNRNLLIPIILSLYFSSRVWPLTFTLKPLDQFRGGHVYFTNSAIKDWVTTLEKHYLRFRWSRCHVIQPHEHHIYSSLSSKGVFGVSVSYQKGQHNISWSILFLLWSKLTFLTAPFYMPV